MAHLDLTRSTYAAADTRLGRRSSVKIGHNTTLHRYSGPAECDAIAVRYHSTDIVEFTRDGWIVMHTGGWDTVTTWSRINSLLPGGWAVWSHRGDRSLYRSGRRVTPYADGLSIHAESGAVGLNGDTLLTADDVQAIIDAAGIADAARAEKRAARLLAEHPTAGGPRTHRANLGWGGRPRGCDRCDAEAAAEYAAQKAALAAEHAAMAATLARNPGDADPWTEAEYLAAGSHVTRTPTRDYPPLIVDGVPSEWRKDYSAPGPEYVTVKIACPWQCPEHRY